MSEWISLTRDCDAVMIPSGQSVDEMRVRENLEELKASVHADAEAWSFADEDRVLATYVQAAESARV